MKYLRMMSVVCLVVVSSAVLTLAQASNTSSDSSSKSKGGPVAGTWECTAHGGENGDIPFTLYIDQDHETVTGSVSSTMGDADISEATFKDGKLEIHINGGDANYVLTAELHDGQLSGDWSNGDTEKGKWEGKKSAETK